jgi:hypothetical protein
MVSTVINRSTIYNSIRVISCGQKPYVLNGVKKTSWKTVWKFLRSHTDYQSAIDLYPRQLKTYIHIKLIEGCPQHFYSPVVAGTWEHNCP